MEGSKVGATKERGGEIGREKERNERLCTLEQEGAKVVEEQVLLFGSCNHSPLTQPSPTPRPPPPRCRPPTCSDEGREFEIKQLEALVASGPSKGPAAAASAPSGLQTQTSLARFGAASPPSTFSDLKLRKRRTVSKVDKEYDVWALAEEALGPMVEGEDQKSKMEVRRQGSTGGPDEEALAGQV